MKLTNIYQLITLFTLVALIASCGENVPPCAEESRIMSLSPRDSALVPYKGDSVIHLRYVRTAEGIKDTVTLTGGVAEYTRSRGSSIYEGDCQIWLQNTEKVMSFSDSAGEVDMTFRLFTTNSEYSTLYVKVNSPYYTSTGVYYVLDNGEFMHEYPKSLPFNGVWYDNILYVDNRVGAEIHNLYYNDKHGVLFYANPYIKLEILPN